MMKAMIPVWSMCWTILVTCHTWADTHYVWSSGGNVSPYTNWQNAATTVAAAITQASAGDLVWVTNGTYVLNAQISLTKGVTVASVNGPAVTTLDGNNVTRVAYLSHTGAVLRGFTIQRGYGVSASGGGVSVVDGGIVERCIIRNNRVWSSTGPVGAGGGANLVGVSTLRNCLVVSNDADCADNLGASLRGGGVHMSNGGSGTDTPVLESCTIEGNSARTAGGGIRVQWYGTIRNCIIYGNQNGNVSTESLGPGITFVNCCASPAPTNGVGNINVNPKYVSQGSGDYRLVYGSPCIDKGSNVVAGVTNDITGNSRKLDGDLNGTTICDIGAYEYNPSIQDSDTDGINDQWEYYHGLNPTNTADAHLRSDSDVFDNFDEYIADTDPLNSNSYLRVSGLTNGLPFGVGFMSSSNRLYSLQWTTNLQAAGSWTNLPGHNGTAGNGGPHWLSDTNAGARRYYRIGVQVP